MSRHQLTVALYALEIGYTRYWYWAGMATASTERTRTGRWFRGMAKRLAIKAKTEALIAHDREVTGRSDL